MKKILDHEGYTLFEITAEQEANLRKLAHGLRTMPPPDVAFDMGRFSQDAFDHTKPTCGSVGCAIGCATLIIEPRRAIGDNTRHESWTFFAYRLFGMSLNVHNAEPMPDDEYDARERAGVFLFDGYWTQRDNTAIGAAERIEYLLDRGMPQGRWSIDYKGYKSP